MIRNLKANGFRSLEGFDIELRPGLNVLAGPNGGGKTNILALLSFISKLSNSELGEAINESGGVSKVFKKLGDASFAKTIEIEVSGYAPFDGRYYYPASYRKYAVENRLNGLRYQWNLTIDASRGYDETFYSFQSLKTAVVLESLFARDEGEWDAELSIYSPDGQHFDVKERISDGDNSSLLFEDGHSKKSRTFGLSDYDEKLEFRDNPIHVFIFRSPLIRSIIYDLRSGTTFNFDPAICKQSNDSAQSANLGKDGTGLAATIFAIQKAYGKEPAVGPLYSPKIHFPSHIYDSLVSYFKLINSNIVDIRAQNDPINNKITALIRIDGDGSTVSFPIEFASDGTVKWLAFVTALLTESTGFAVEEPENFLHPEIQRQAVELVRAETEGAENSFVLLTTHSETLLNATLPEELVIVSMSGGVTSSKRLDNPDEIDREIQDTGFGLGYYYLSGALYE